MSRLIAITGLLLLFPFVSSSQSIRVCEDDDDNNVFIPISKYMQKGDAEARQIIRNFFTNYTPRCFEIVYKSGTYPMKYAVGNLDSGGNMFTVTILVKTYDAGNYIEQLKIEKQ